MRLRFILPELKMVRPRKGLHYLVIIVTLVCLCRILLTTSYSHMVQNMDMYKETSGCKLPMLDPWDYSVHGYLKKEPQLKCSGNHPIMYVDETEYLVLNRSAITEYSLGALKCAYHVVRRYGDNDVTFDSPVAFEPPVFIEAGVFRVVCESQSGRVVYDYVHVNVAWTDPATKRKQISKETDEQLSIIILGFDSVSRSHAIRNLPLSYKYLTETLGAYDFQGYTKTGANTLANIMPLLTGQGLDAAPIRDQWFDNHTFIWRDKAMQRYVTYYSEDFPIISTFNYGRLGFKNPPTDFYYRPYALAMHATEPLVGNKVGNLSVDCYGNQEQLLLHFDCVKRFLTKYTNHLKFVYFWNNQLSHESFTKLRVGDVPLLNLLTWLHQGHHLDRSILVVGSDHGFRQGGYTTTYTGQLENRMPFLTVRLPDGLVAKHPWIHDKLAHNSKRLVTTYDLYETMLSVINSDFAGIQKPVVPVKSHLVRRSLFSRIPEGRTCEDAGIPPNYCTCLDMKTVDPTSDLVQSLAVKVTETINDILDKYKHLCHKLQPLNVSESKVVYSSYDKPGSLHNNQRQPLSYDTSQTSRFNYTGRYNLLFYTRPNNGIFQATLVYEQKAMDGQVDKVTLVGNPERLDRYGPQAGCVKGTDVEQYCYCIV